MNCPEFSFVDLAVGGVDRRNNPVPIGEVRARVNGSADSYITVHRFPEEFRQYVQATGSVRDWVGPSWADYLAWDIDRDPDRLDEARRATMALGFSLQETYGVDPAQLRTFFSGRKGFHLLLPTALLGPLTPSPELAGLLKDLALEIASEAGVEVDETIYDRTRLFRLPNTKHSVSGLYKVELSWDELVNLDAGAIQELAASPRDFEWAPDHLESLPALEALLERVAEREPESTTGEVAPPVEGRIPGPPNGRRDSTLTSLGGTMRRRGMEEPEIRAALLEINRRRCDPPLSEDQVWKIAASVARYDPNPDAVPQGGREGEKPKLPSPMGVSDLLGVEEPDEEWLAHGILPAGGNVLVAGYPKTFKTLYLLDLGVSLASGTPFLGKYEVPEKRRVGIVLMEDQAHRVRRRLQRLCEGKGIALPTLEGWLYLWFRPPLRLNDQTAVELANYVAELDLDFLGVDSWAYVASGDSNSADEVTPQLQALTYARVKRPGLTVQLTHHARKDHGKKDAGSRLTDEIRNSGAFGAWFDAGMVLSRKDETSPVTVRTELRDFPTPESFAFSVEDEVPAYPGNDWNPQGWLRLVVSKYRPEIVDRMATVEALVPAVREFLSLNPGCSKRKLREGVKGRAQDVDGALELLEQDGEVEILPPEGKGKPSKILLLEGGE